MGFMNLFKLWGTYISDPTKKVTSTRDVKVKRTKKQQVMRYLLNDPATPNLVLDRKSNRLPTVYPPFSVRGYVGNRIQMWTPEWRAAQIHHAFVDTLHTMQPAFKKAPRRWPGTRQLKLIPNAGRDFNAYYDRHHLCFFHDLDPVKKKMVYSGESVDIVAHEAGHALLDAIRPRFWNMQALEIWAFHEAWSDIVALLTVMKHDKVLKHVLNQTQGDLTKPNIVAMLGEEMGTGIYHVALEGYGYKPGRLRDANNKFVYKAPEKLPKDAPDDKLARECHSFGRVFLGAFYEIMTKVFRYEVNDGHDSMEALRRTRHVCAKLIARSAQAAPATPRFYDAVARTMLGVDKGLGGKFGHILRQVFNSRKILSRRSIKAQAAVKLNEVEIKEGDNVDEYNEFTTITKQSVKTVKLADHFGVRAQGDNPLYECEIEVPNSTYMEFDAEGNMVNSVATSPRIAINSARDCINFLHDKNMVGESSVVPDVAGPQFSVVDGKLVRNFFI